MVQRHQAGENFFVAQIDRPAIGLGHGGIEFVVNLPQHGNQPLLVNFLLFLGERFACTQLFQHVVHAGHRQLRMQFLLTFAMGIELFAKVANAGFL